MNNTLIYSDPSILANQKVLITGASGFLGTHLSRELSKYNVTLFGIDRNPPKEPWRWKNFIKVDGSNVNYAEIENEKISYCFHLMGSASVQKSLEDPIQDFASLLPSSLRLILFLKNNCKNVHNIIFSSAAVYGNPSQYPIIEESNCKPISPYGIHKLTMENLWEHYSRIYNLKTSILRIFSAYGTGLRRQLFWDIFQKHLATEKGKPIYLNGTGNETRDFINATDVARAACIIAANSTNSNPYEVFNIASGIETTIRDGANLLLGGEREIIFDGTVRPGDPTRWVADISKIKSIGYEHKITLEEGLFEYSKYAQTII